MGGQCLILMNFYRIITEKLDFLELNPSTLLHNDAEQLALKLDSNFRTLLSSTFVNGIGIIFLLPIFTCAIYVLFCNVQYAITSTIVSFIT